MGVYIGWEVRQETGTIGFNVYRLGGNGPELVNQTIIHGGAINSSRPIQYATKYEIFDPQGGVKSSYIVRSIAVDGRQSDTATVFPKFTFDFKLDTGHTKGYFLDTRKKNSNLRSTELALPLDLETVVRNTALAPNLATQRYVASQPGAKIAVRKEGIYTVSRAELQNAGFNVNSNSVNWRLFLEGNEQAILIGAGDQYIRFYGKGMDTRESDTRTYYLISDGVAGKRMIPRILRPLGGNVVTQNYRATSITKDRSFYAPSVKNGDAENYFGRLVTSAVTNIPFELSGVDAASASGTVFVKMQGLLGPTHTVNIAVNGNAVGAITGVDLLSFSGEFVIPTSFLIDGTNILSLNNSLSSDANLFDSVSVKFGRKFKADQNQIEFYTPGYRKADVGGFSTSNIVVFDTTFDANTQIVINPNIVAADGAFTVKLPADRAAVMYAVEDSATLQSPLVTANTASSYSAENDRADMVIISHSDPDFISSANNWAAYRRNRAGGAFSVKVIDVADIFDEYSYGVLSAEAINQFLQEAKDHWQTKYVLLLGDGSRDPRNYEGAGYNDLIPTTMVDLIYEETGSDDALTDFDHDGLADIPIGRIPARSTNDINVALAKTMTFETPVLQSLDRGVACAYDLPQSYDFEAMCQSVLLQLPTGTPLFPVGRGFPAPNQNQADPEAQARLLTVLNNGPIAINYSGHGSSGAWASVNFFGNPSIPSLNNISKPTVFTMLTCLNGYFLRPRLEDTSIAELLVTSPTGGAVATWSSTTDTTPDIQGVMGERFYNQLGIGQIKRMGDLIKDAKSTIAGSDVGYSWVLLGDPALQVRP